MNCLALYDNDSNMYICENCGEELDEILVEIGGRCPDCKSKITGVTDDPEKF